MEDSKILDICTEDIKLLPGINPILPKLRRESNNFTCNLADTTVDSDNSENLQSCGSVCVYNFQQQFIFNCEFCDLKYGDLDNFKRHLHEAHNLFQLEADTEKENAEKKPQSSKVCTAVKKEPLEPPIDLPSTYFTEPLVSCGAVFIFNQQKFHLACGYCDCSKYDNLDMFEKHVKQQHNILEGAHNELNAMPKVEVSEEVFLITEVVEPTEVKVEKEEPLEEGILDIKHSYSNDEEEEDDEESETDEDDKEFIDEDDEEFIAEDDDDEEGEEDETEDEQNTSKATKRKKQESPSDEPSTSSSAKTKRKTKPEKIECQIIHKRITRRNLSRHKKLHLRESAKIVMRKCDECDKTYFTNSDLRNHIMKHHAKDESKKAHPLELNADNQVFDCEHCNKTFKKRPYLTVHLRTHTGEKPFKCQICQKRFRDHGNFSLHKKRHLGDAGKTAKCEYCDKTYLTNGGIRNHIMKHHFKEESKKAQPLELNAVDRVFNCEHCNKNFKRRLALTEHLRIHTGEKPYECKICQQRFRTQGNYNIHKKRHQGDAAKTKKCDYCEKKFLTNIEVRRHIERVHKEEFKTS